MASKDTKKTTLVESEDTQSTSDTGVKEKMVVKDIDPDQIVTVKNGFQGVLVYQSKRTGELFVWESFGEEQDMELSELKNAKGQAKNFFINNWFMFDEQWIVDYLGMSKFYKHAVKIEDFDKIFKKTPSEIEKIIATMSDGQKKSAAYRARQLISDGEIDSNKVISALEACLNTELIER